VLHQTTPQHNGLLPIAATGCLLGQPLQRFDITPGSFGARPIQPVIELDAGLDRESVQQWTAIQRHHALVVSLSYCAVESPHVHRDDILVQCHLSLTASHNHSLSQLLSQHV
jgi:hypothetical protein